MRKIDFEQSDDPAISRFAALEWSGAVSSVARSTNRITRRAFTRQGDVQTLQNDIQWAKEFGFNFLRVHIKIDDPLLYYWADKLGILLMADMPNFGEGGDTPLGRKRWETMMREAIKRDFNHPSIFSWCIFNETWGFGGPGRIDQALRSIQSAQGARINRRAA
jgi:beta-galactosidase/beta-glucuronidase